MLLASYNVENLFERPRAFRALMTDGSNPVLDHQAELNRLFDLPTYRAADKRRMVDLLFALRLERSDDGTGDVMLRKNRGHLLKRDSGTIEITAAGRSDWNGWAELKREVIDEESYRNTARVIAEVGAHVQAVVEAESRPALRAFASDLVVPRKGRPFDRTMLIDGNDDRGIDVGILTRGGWEIVEMRSHVDDQDDRGEIFSRDCPEYFVRTRSGNEIVVLVNHFKSQIGNREVNDRKRERQSTEVAKIYRRLLRDGHDNVAIVGDFNAGPDDGSITPLTNGIGLRDAADGPSFDDGGFEGTYGPTARQKFDYVLLSPSLFARMRGGGIFRKGVWTDQKARRWEIFDTMSKPADAASDHAAVYVDLDL